MRTYFSLILGCCLAIAAMSSCKKSDSSTPNNTETAPTGITVGQLLINNLNTSSYPAGKSLDYCHVEIYSGNVLLVKTYSFSPASLPAQVGCDGVNAFSYNMKEYDLKFIGVEGTSGAATVFGTVHLALKDYSSATYPKPADMFFNTNGFAGTLSYNYY